jgi:hypothetical protein
MYWGCTGYVLCTIQYELVCTMKTQKMHAHNVRIRTLNLMVISLLILPKTAFQRVFVCHCLTCQVAFEVGTGRRQSKQCRSLKPPRSCKAGLRTSTYHEHTQYVLSTYLYVLSTYSVRTQYRVMPAAQ